MADKKSRSASGDWAKLIDAPPSRTKATRAAELAVFAFLFGTRAGRWILTALLAAGLATYLTLMKPWRDPPEYSVEGPSKDMLMISSARCFVDSLEMEMGTRPPYPSGRGRGLRVEWRVQGSNSPSTTGYQVIYGDRKATTLVPDACARSDSRVVLTVTAKE